MLKNKTMSYETELLDACEFGDLESVCDMLANGANPKKQYLDKGETALHWAARYVYNPISISTVRFILKG